LHWHSSRAARTDARDPHTKRPFPLKGSLGIGVGENLLFHEASWTTRIAQSQFLLGRELNARYVLEGSVRRARNRVRIAAPLIDAGNGHHLWAQTYDRRLGDLSARL